MIIRGKLAKELKCTDQIALLTTPEVVEGNHSAEYEVYNALGLYGRVGDVCYSAKIANLPAISGLELIAVQQHYTTC